MTADEWREERARLVPAERYAAAEAEWIQLDQGPRAAGPSWKRVEKLFDRYAEILPRVPVARSPLTGVVVRHQVDTAGLDGRFWDEDKPWRAPQPAGWLAMTGSMRLAKPYEVTGFQVAPGPDAPYVAPRLLRSPGVRAVISQVAVGRHTGWPVTYFGAFAQSTELENLWGMERYPVYSVAGEFTGWGCKPAWSPEEYDFDLLPWLESGRLLWIEPGDESATLREGAADCPYVGLPGTRGRQSLRKGRLKVWSPGGYVEV